MQTGGETQYTLCLLCELRDRVMYSEILVWVQVATMTWSSKGSTYLYLSFQPSLTLIGPDADLFYLVRSCGLTLSIGIG